MSFSTEQELGDFLGGLDVRYRNYAAPLWDSGVATADELANGSIDSLVAAGISNRIHAENIKAKAGVHAGPGCDGWMCLCGGS